MEESDRGLLKTKRVGIQWLSTLQAASKARFVTQTLASRRELGAVSHAAFLLAKVTKKQRQCSKPKEIFPRDLGRFVS